MTENPYDQAPYPGLSYGPTHPDRLALTGRLLGLSPAPVEHCRVLELGCAVGGNLIPLAYGLPDSRFLGIDYSANQIQEAQAAAAELALPNVAFRHLDIMDVPTGGDDDLGEFDYIIAHGLYSWVPEAVRSKILDICRHNLAPDGVAYVSYNTYPGWHMVGIVRDMLLYHTRHTADPLARAGQAREVIDFFAQATASDQDAYSSFLDMYATILSEKGGGSSDRYATLVLHDEMSEINQPFYFYQFAEQIEKHGLQYLGEADLSGMRGRLVEGGNIPPQVAEGLKRWAGDLVELEQAVDFLHNRMFRRTLLCHQEIELLPRFRLDAVKECYVNSRARPAVDNPDLYSVSVVKFESSDGPAIATDHPVSKVAFGYLVEQWPAVVPFDRLLEVARARCAARAGTGAIVADRDADARVLAGNLLTAYGYSTSLVDLYSYRPRFAPRAGERPVASAVACFQIQRGDQATNLRHERVTLDGLDAFLLLHLDGSRDRAALLDLLMEGPVAQGVLTVQRGGEPPEQPSPGEQDIRAMLAEEVERRLDWLASAALLLD